MVTFPLCDSALLLIFIIPTPLSSCRISHLSFLKPGVYRPGEDDSPKNAGERSRLRSDNRILSCGLHLSQTVLLQKGPIPKDNRLRPTISAALTANRPSAALFQCLTIQLLFTTKKPLGIISVIGLSGPPLYRPARSKFFV
jgi:hypothetical protein